MMNRAQTFPLLACLLLAAIISFAPVLGMADASAPTADGTANLLAQTAVTRVSDMWAKEQVARPEAGALAESTALDGAAFIIASGVPSPRPTPIQEGPNEATLSGTPLAQFDGHLLSS